MSIGVVDQGGGEGICLHAMGRRPPSPQTLSPVVPLVPRTQNSTGGWGKKKEKSQQQQYRSGGRRKGIGFDCFAGFSVDRGALLCFAACVLPSSFLLLS